jgi:LPXTG-motif cell wall-anchored protein
LPNTASPLPLLGLIGLLSLGAGFALSVIRKRSA